MSPLSRSAALALAASLAAAGAFALGCGAPAKPAKSRNDVARPRPPGDDGSGTEIAARARAATLARQGTYGKRCQTLPLSTYFLNNIKQ